MDSLAKKNNDLSQEHIDARSLSFTERAEPYDPKIMLLPNILNDETAPLLGDIFANITKDSTKIKRIILFSDSMVKTKEKCLYSTSPNNPFLQKANIDNSDLATIDDPNNFIQYTDDETEFVNNFGCTLPYLNYLLPQKTVLPIINNGLSAKEIINLLTDIEISSSNLYIFTASLSMGLSRAEAISYDTPIIARLISQEGDFHSYETPSYITLNLCSLISRYMRLRPHFFEYVPVKYQGRKIIKTRGVCTIGYFV